jgi:arylsulfatase A-like enzyme
VLLTLVAVGCRSRGCAGPREQTGHSIVLIVIDSLRADHLGLYGYPRPTSPRLDALGARSLVVEQMIAQAPWTKPSVASIFTSLMPQDHGVVHEPTDNVLADELVTVAEALRDDGFRTAGFSENPHIQRSLGFAQGFDEFAAAEHWLGDPRAMARQASSWLDDHDAERFFLYVHFLDPHAAYTPREPFRTDFLAGRSTADPRIARAQVDQLQQDDGQLKQPMSAADLDYLVALYDAEIGAADDAVGEILDELDDLGLTEHTIVLVTSDHGEEFLEHGRLEHGKQVYEESIHVPLILHVPGMAARRDRASVVQHIDIAPTLLQLANVPAPEQFHGRSMVPLLVGAELAPVAAVSQTSWREHHATALRSGEWKLVVDRVKDRPELFHLPSDPGETHDVRADHEALAETLQHEMAARVAPTLAITVDAAGTRNPRLETALESLGYLGHDH